MKKILSIIVIAAGLILAAIGIDFKMKESAAIGIIGGADGPTSIFIAGKVGAEPGLAFILLGAAVVVGIVIYMIISKK